MINVVKKIKHGTEMGGCSWRCDLGPLQAQGRTPAGKHRGLPWGLCCLKKEPTRGVILQKLLPSPNTLSSIGLGQGFSKHIGRSGNLSELQILRLSPDLLNQTLLGMVGTSPSDAHSSLRSTDPEPRYPERGPGHCSMGAPPGSLLECRTLHSLDQNLHSNKIPRRPVCTSKLEKRWSRLCRLAPPSIILSSLVLLQAAFSYVLTFAFGLHNVLKVGTFFIKI